ncbi:MAG: CvpA family protein [Clostridia bacterium]|nr:CvpA family protein [Clostridia bacterium]
MKTKILSRIIKILICIPVLLIAFWFMLPPLNLRAPEFWTFVITSIIICLGINFISEIVFYIRNHTEKGKLVNLSFDFKSVSAPVKVFGIVIAIIVLFLIIGAIIGSQFFNASRYNKLISPENGDFIADVSEISQEQIPVVDRDTASRLGQRKLGEMSDLVSQFEIMDIYTQINYKGRPVRVTPLIYGDVIKWLNNRSQGIPAYITVDMTSQETALVRLKDGGIKYSTGEYFMRNVTRYLRYRYPTKVFDNISFEIDENGTPYWVVSTVKYRIGVFGGRDIGGTILLNAQTGQTEYYGLEEIPAWVDQVFDSNMVLNQLNYNGKYRSGFINSVFGQKGVLQTTDGYNYLAINDDVYLYTGMTSVTSDESNVGFVLTNLRTKQTKYYAIPGAEEYSAMDSAQGQVQHLAYKATFPLLLNISHRPTYFMSLKDGAGLVKMYAFVDVQQYQVVGTGTSVDSARKDYISKLKDEKIEAEDIEQKTVEGVIERISQAVIDGNTNYFILLEKDENVYMVPVNLSYDFAIAEVGDRVELTLKISNEETKVESALLIKQNIIATPSRDLGK